MFDWQPYGQVCTTYQQGAIVMECESSAIYAGPFDMSKGWWVSADVKGRSMSDDPRFWCSMALNSDIPADNRYASVGIEQGIAPYWGDEQSYGVHLSTPADRCCDRMVEIEETQRHHLTLVYRPGRAEYEIDGVQANVSIDLGPAASVGLLAVAVDPGETKTGNLARCEWRNVKIAPLHTTYIPSAYASGPYATQHGWSSHSEGSR